MIIQGIPNFFHITLLNFSRFSGPTLQYKGEPRKVPHKYFFVKATAGEKKVENWPPGGDTATAKERAREPAGP
jgi:hypothetical protein